MDWETEERQSTYWMPTHDLLPLPNGCTYFSSLLRSVGLISSQRSGMKATGFGKRVGL